MRSKVQPVQIAIVGGGPAGLSTGAFIKLGAKPVVFDRNARIGGSWRRRYDRLHLHTTRRFSGLAHYPIPRSYPQYLSRDMYAEYLELYAEQLAVEVALGCSVESIGLAASSDRETSAFDLQTSRGRIFRVRCRRRDGHVRRIRHAASSRTRRLSRYGSPCLRVRERPGICSKARPCSRPRQHRGGDCDRPRRPLRGLRRGKRSLGAASGAARPPRRPRSTFRHRAIASFAGNCRPHRPRAVPIGSWRPIALRSSGARLVAVLIAAYTGDRRRLSPTP